MQPRKLYLLMISFTLLASLTHILGKPAAAGFPILLLTFLSLTIGTGTLSIFLWLRRKPFTVQKGQRLSFFRLSLIGVVANILFFLWGLRYTIPAHPGLLYATTPIWTLIIAGIFGREIIVRQKVVGVVLSIIGVTIVMGGSVLHLNLDYLLGDSLILVAVLCWSAYTVFSKPFVMQYHALTSTFTITLFGMLMLLPFGVWEASTFDFGTVPFSAWLGLGYMGIFTSATSYLIYYAVLKQIQPTQLAVIITGQAPMTAVLSWIFQGYSLTWTFGIGSFVTLIGIFITLKLSPTVEKMLQRQAVAKN